MKRFALTFFSFKFHPVRIGGFLLAAGAVVWFVNCLPDPLFRPGYSSVLHAADGSILAARIAPDEHWRFPPSDSLPEKFTKALVTYEDRGFHSHIGFSISGLTRAAYQNFKGGKRISGGSTITMQVVRMARGNPKRSYWEKFTEILRATRLEMKMSKAEIMEAWAAHAPFGGNVVGLQAAAWRYFGQSPHDLTWAQTATLVVLPNSPALIHPGRNRDALRAKRDRLLDALRDIGHIDEEDCLLSKMEDLPGIPFDMPQEGGHLLTSLAKKYGYGKLYESTIDRGLQVRLREVMNRHHGLLAASFIHNMACIVIDHEKNEVIAYAGNIHDRANRHANQVDCARAPRSSGSVFKPFLYALALDEGLLLPTQLLSDIPFSIGGFSPKNHNESYDGAVPANEALTRSLNVTAVKLLREYNEERFLPSLRQLGLSNLTKPSGHYGLTIVVGGAESNLWDLTRAYAAMARGLKRFGSEQLWSDKVPAARVGRFIGSCDTIRLPFGPGAIYATFEIMTGLNRPEEASGWEHFESSRTVAWKTGTSQGNRDAWAIGVDGRYAVGVWVGNADGVGRDNLTGVGAAAPVLFDVFDLLPRESWFIPPYDAMEKIEVCRQSGYLPSPICADRDSVWVPDGREMSRVCPYHVMVFSDSNGRRVHTGCANIEGSTPHSWFSLPPKQQSYFRKRHPDYRPLPPWAPGCDENEDGIITLLTPVNLSGLFIPTELGGATGRIIFSAAHQYGKREPIYWHLDDEFLGITDEFHELAVHALPGEHRLTLVDRFGNRSEYPFTLLGKENKR